MDSWTYKESTSVNEYSLNKVTVTLKLAPISLYGQIKVDEVGELTKIIPKYIASTYSEILKYY